MQKLPISLLALIAYAGANEGQQRSERLIRPHRIYVGPDVFFQYRKEKIMDNLLVKEQGMSYGLKLGYEYLRPKAVYAGIDTMAAVGRIREEISLHSWKNVYTTVLDYKQTVVTVRNELRLGYTAQAHRWIITPFIGGGFNYFRRNYFYLDSAYQTYAAAGVHNTVQLSDLFDTGLNLKAMYIFYEGGYFYPVHFWGYEIDVPLTWHVDKSRHWDLRLEPYFLQGFINEATWMVGARLLCGYSF